MPQSDKDCVLQMNNEVIIADFTRDIRESEIPGDVLQILLANHTTGNCVKRPASTRARLDIAPPYCIQSTLDIIQLMKD